jgi:polar amino acid transport system substrate-binding protein
MHYLWDIKMKKNIVTLLLLPLILLGCNEDAEKTLTMGTSADYPPFESMQNGQFVGYDIDLAKAIANKLGYKLVIKEIDFAGLIPALNSKVIDFAISAINPSPERQVNTDFSVVYYRGMPSVLSKKDHLIASLDQLKNKVVGVQLGSTWEAYAKSKMADIGGMKIQSLGKIPQLLEELKVDRINALIIEQEQASEICKANSNLTYKIINDYSNGYAIAFIKNSELKDKFNNAIEDLVVSGEMDELKNKWLAK